MRSQGGLDGAQYWSGDGLLGLLEGGEQHQRPQWREDQHCLEDGDSITDGAQLGVKNTVDVEECGAVEVLVDNTSTRRWSSGST